MRGVRKKSSVFDKQEGRLYGWCIVRWCGGKAIEEVGHWGGRGVGGRTASVLEWELSTYR